MTDDTTLTTSQLAKRWSMTPEALRQWRVIGKGPGWFRLGDSERSHVRYRLADVLAFEQARGV